MHRLLTISLLVFGLNRGSSAAECTDAEDQSITDAYTAAAATSACSSYASTGVLVMLFPPCSATNCIAVMQDLAHTIPNCTSSGVSTSEKDQLLQSLSTCATPASTVSSTNCTISEADETFNAFYTAATGDVCASAATIDSYSVVLETPCNSTCATTIRDLVASVPNCNYDLAYNNKEDIETQFTICERVSNATTVSIIISTDHNLLESTDSSTVSPSVTNCTADEVRQTLEYYVAVATNESCQNNASICSYDISVVADCSTPCGELIEELWSELPQCYYDGTDHKQNVLESWGSCDYFLSPNRIAINFHYSDVLNATGTPTRGGDSDFDFDSPIISDDRASSAQEDNNAQTAAASWAIMAVAGFSLAMGA